MSGTGKAKVGPRYSTLIGNGTTELSPRRHAPVARGHVGLKRMVARRMEMQRLVLMTIN
jgi:hypothetical protein